MQLETFVFKGQTRFRCPFPDCRFDSCSEGEVLKHYHRVHHASKPSQTISPQATLFDYRGARLEQQEPQEPMDLPEPQFEFSKEGRMPWPNSSRTLS